MDMPKAKHAQSTSFPTTILSTSTLAYLREVHAQTEKV
jgi:hypothetical protein